MSNESTHKRDKNLHNRRVLVTRPTHQQSNFLKLCHEANIEPIILPCLDILPVECDIDVNETSNAELIFFTSRNAVEFAHAVRPLPWPEAKVYAIGRATERVLGKLGQTLVHPPIEPYNSETFLEWYATQPPIKTALIIKGLGGRDLIEKELALSGAKVSVKAVYKRVTPVVSDAERKRVFVDTPASVICITSDEILRSLVNIAGQDYADVLHATPLVVNSERCAKMAVKLGFDDIPKVAYPPGDAGQLAAVLDWVNS